MGGTFEHALREAELALEVHSLVRPKHLAERGVSHAWLSQLCLAGPLTRHPPGVFGPKGLVFPRAVCAAVKWPNAVVAGLSALALYELCPEPIEICLAIDAKARAPRCNELPVRFVRARRLRSDPDVRSLRFGGAEVAVFSPARALFDCLTMLERLPLALVRFALKTALDRGVCDPARICELGSHRRNRREVGAALTVLASEEYPPQQAVAAATYVDPRLMPGAVRVPQRVRASPGR